MMEINIREKQVFKESDFTQAINLKKKKVVPLFQGGIFILKNLVPVCTLCFSSANRQQGKFRNFEIKSHFQYH